MRWPSLWASSSPSSLTPAHRDDPDSVNTAVESNQQKYYFPSASTDNDDSSNKNKNKSNNDQHTPTGSLSSPSPFTQPSTILAAVALSVAFLGGQRVYVNYLRRVPEAKDIKPAWLQQRRSILGTVTSVGDGDNFRLFHTPGGRLAGWGWLPGRRIPTAKGQLKGKTIHVRLAGVDAPELAHFGKPAQPYGQEALDWLRSAVLHRRVRVYLLQADQYQRVVATAYVWKWSLWNAVRLQLRQDVGLEMLRAGLATVYEAKTGAVFGPGLQPKYREMEAWAKARKKGMWVLLSNDKKKAGGLHFESPREYKKKYASPPPPPPSRHLP